MKSFNLSEWALRHRSLVTFFMLMIVVAGIADYFKLGRSEDPDFTVKTMVVAATWPGATVEDTLEQITDRLERKLQETPSLDYVKSYTSAGRATIFVNLKDSTPPADVPDIWYQVRKKVRDIAGTLPEGVIGPDFDDEFGDTYGIVYGFTASGFTERELHDYVHDIRKQLLELPDISKIDILGAQDERVYVEFSHERLAGLGIDRSALIGALESQNAVTPAGVVQTSDEKILVRVSGAFRSEHDVLDINFVAGGRMIRLGDIARVSRGPADPAQPMLRVNGQQGIGIAIAMRTGGDVMALGHNVAEAMARITENLPVGIEPMLIANQTVIVEHAVDEFMKALWEAIAIVLGVSLLSLGLRAGAVVALSIPLVLAAVFTVMSFTGIDLQRISLGALIIALGLLVDDAMITVESMVTRLERGDDKEQAATFAYTSTAFPMLTGTLVTVAGFVPIGFARSAAGEYTFSIFAVVAVALLASWFVAVLFSPLLGVWVLKKPKATHSEEPGPILRAFRLFLELAMRWRWITLLVTLGLCALSVLGMRFVPQQFFPSSDRPELLVDLQLPENASIYATRDVSARVDAVLKGDPDVDHWSTYVGRGAVRFYLPLNVQLPKDFFAQAVVVTKGLEERERVKAKLEQTLANEFPSVIGRVYPLELGPPVGWPLQYRVSGPRSAEVRAIAFKVAEILGADPDARNVHYDWMEPARTVRIRVDQDEARLLGLSSQDLAQSLNTVVSGVTATELRSGIHLVDVVVRASAEQRMSLSTIRTLQVPLPNGKTVPLGQIASVEYDQEYPIVWRRDRRPTVTVQADLVPGMQAATVVQAVAPKIEALSASLPYGYRIEVGGTAEESEKAQVSVAAVLPSSWADLRRRRGSLHLVLVTTWVAQARLVAASMGRRGTIGLGLGISGWEYAFTQPYFLCRYLRLTLWPDALALDYGMHRVTSVAEGLPYAAIVAALLGFTIVALWRRPALGFCGAWFFLALAPSSSVVPIASQTGAEHRMYLALAGLVAPVVIGGYAVLGRFFAGRRLAWVAAASLAGATIALGMRTWTRNHDYRSVRALWQTSVDAWPQNPRAHYNLGLESDEAEALVHFQETLRLAPDHYEAYVARGNVLREIGRVEEAVASFERALFLRPDFAEAHNNLANVLAERGDLDAAIEHFDSARRSRPGVAVYALNEGLTLVRAGRHPEAVERFDEALRVEPENASIHFERGRALARAGRSDEGIAALERAARIAPNDARYAAALGQELARIGRFDEAARALGRAVFLDPRSARRRIQLADALVAGGRTPTAFEHYEEAIRLEPRAVQAHAGLAAALTRMGRVREALPEWERAAQLDGGRDPDLLASLAAAYAEAGRLPEAISYAERAVERAQAIGDAAQVNRLQAQLVRLRSDASIAAGAQVGR